jgi:hypothetical protein
MKLISLKWQESKQGQRIKEGLNLTIHEVKSLKMKKHVNPHHGYDASSDSSEEGDGSSDLDFELPPREKKGGWFAKIETKVKKTFCLQLDIQHRLYSAHRNEKIGRSLQKKITRKLDIPVASASESHVTSFEKWQSKHNDWEDGASSSYHAPGHVEEKESEEDAEVELSESEE